MVYKEIKFRLTRCSLRARSGRHAPAEGTGIKIGYSNSRTCEIGLMTNGGIPYESIVYLVDRVTTAK